MNPTIGDFEKLVLLAVLRLGDGAYGAAVVEELEARTARAVSDGAVYVALRRLEEKGLVTTRAGEATAERGGRPRKYVRVESAGVEALREARRTWDALAQGMDDLLGAER